MVLGVVILVMGGILVLQALGLISGNFWPLFWGVLLVVLGLKLITRKKRCWHCDWFGQHRNHHDHGHDNDHSHMNQDGQS